jgi:hypothetical protein
MLLAIGFCTRVVQSVHVSGRMTAQQFMARMTREEIAVREMI